MKLLMLWYVQSATGLGECLPIMRRCASPRRVRTAAIARVTRSAVASRVATRIRLRSIRSVARFWRRCRILRTLSSATRAWIRRRSTTFRTRATTRTTTRSLTTASTLTAAGTMGLLLLQRRNLINLRAYRSWNGASCFGIVF